MHAALSMPCGLALWGVRHGAALAARPDELAGLSEAEFRAGDGPGLTAIRLRQPVSCPDLAADARGPAWRRQVLRHGVRSALVVPMDVGRDTVATLSLYLDTATDLPAYAQVTAHVLAEHSGLFPGRLLRRRPVTYRCCIVPPG